MKNKNRGILYLAFGKEFDKLTAATAGYSRKFTNLPICVLSNLRERSSTWDSVSDVCFKFISSPSGENRKIKVSLINYTPYDETLFMDSDAVIQNHGIESLFTYLKDFDIVCQFFATLYQNDKNFEQVFIEKTYGKLAILLQETYPIELFGEAALLFSKTKSCEKFFSLWEKYWELMGSGRDMPAFSFAVRHLRNSVKAFKNNEVQFCTNVENENFFIQHKGFGDFEKKFGLPIYIDWNPKL